MAPDETTAKDEYLKMPSLSEMANALYGVSPLQKDTRPKSYTGHVINLSDLVCLRGVGPTMTVIGIQDQLIDCGWFNANNDYQTYSFIAKTLVHL